MATFSVRKRKDSNTWMIDVRDPSFPNGKKRKSGFKTKKEAQYAAQEIVDNIIKGVPDNANITFQDYYNKWIINNGKLDLSSTQSDWYRRAIRYFTEYFGDNFPVKNVYRQDYQKFLNEYGQGRTRETVRKVHICLSQALKDAVYDGLIMKDPTYKTDLKGTKAAKKEEDKYFTIQQYLDMIEYVKYRTEKSYIMVHLMALTGGRFSEINRMTWDDLNKSPGVIHLPGTKTDAAPRDIEMNVEDIELIKKKLRTHPRRIDGKILGISHNAVYKILPRVKKAANIPVGDKTTPYAFRHTHCSYLLSKGVKIEYISGRLGHSSIAFTLETYAHLLAEHKIEQGEKVRAIYS